MFSKPEVQHEWFADFLGSWTFVHECRMGKEGNVQRSEGQLTARTMGGLWLLMECCGQAPEGDGWQSLFTLGFDAVARRYRGTFIASMMTHLWIYDGELDETGQALVMNVEGPGLDGRTTANYRDIFQKVDTDHWMLRSLIQLPDGQWNEFMVGHHYRVKDAS